MRLIDADALRESLFESSQFDTYNDYSMVLDTIDLASTIEPERKKGQWINDKGLYKCTSCGELWTECWASCVPLAQIYKELKYCPKCGAKMEEEIC